MNENINIIIKPQKWQIELDVRHTHTRTHAYTHTHTYTETDKDTDPQTETQADIDRHKHTVTHNTQTNTQQMDTHIIHTQSHRYWHTHSAHHIFFDVVSESGMDRDIVIMREKAKCINAKL